ncbi:MAG: inositol-3-phosphate synthase [Promethearchaeota archaeon]
MQRIRVALAGIGNAASAFLQGINFYSNDVIPDVVYESVGGFRITDINITAAFDVAANKVGKPLEDAIFAEPNNCPKYTEVIPTNILVQMGPVLDGVTGPTKSVVKVSDAKEADIVSILKDSNTDILVVLLPSGSNEAVKAYAQAAIDAGCAFVNATPTPIVTDPTWVKKFKAADLPVVGDDLQSLAGGTRIHKGLLEMLDSIGLHIENTYQLDVSGGLEGLTTLDTDRRMWKRRIKTESIRRVLPYLSENDLTSGTTDYLDFLGNRRTGYFWIQANAFMKAPLLIDITVKSLDGPNGAATLVDVVRAVKIGLNRAVGGPLLSVCAYGFKLSTVFISEQEAGLWFEEFIEGRRMN